MRLREAEDALVLLPPIKEKYQCDGCGMLQVLEAKETHDELFCPKPVTCLKCHGSIIYANVAPELGSSPQYVLLLPGFSCVTRFAVFARSCNM